MKLAIVYDSVNDAVILTARIVNASRFDDGG